MKKSLFSIIIFALLLACAPEDNSIVSSETMGVNRVSAISAVLLGKAYLGSTLSSDLQVGFQYSTSAGILPSNSTIVEAKDADSNYNYFYELVGLEPSTTYYFRSFVRQNGQDTYGDIKEFTTKEIASLIQTKDALNVDVSSATLSAKLDLSDISYDSVSYGFYWGSSELSQNLFVKGGDICDANFNSTLSNLSHKTQYWYKASVNLDGQVLFGSLKTFTTGFIPVESVSLDQSDLTFNSIGMVNALIASVLPSNASDKGLEWSSSNEDVATVDADGVLAIVRAKGNGTAIITVTTKDQGKKATCKITVAQLVSSISLNKTSLSLNEGEQEVLSARPTPDNAADKTLFWTSSDNSVATVDQNGKVTAVSKGSTTIRVEAKDGSGAYAMCAVNVRKPVSYIELSRTSIVIYLNSDNLSESIMAVVSPSDATDKRIEWTSSNQSVATVSNGVVTGKAVGTTTITAKAKDGSGVKATCDVVVRQDKPIFVLSTTVLNAGPKTTSSSFSIETSNYVEWTAVSSSPDFTLSAGSGSGSADIKVSFTANPAPSPRSATITVSTTNDEVETKSWTVTITQGPASAGDIDDGTPGYDDHLISRRKI